MLHVLFCRQTRALGLHSKVFIFISVAFFGAYVLGSMVVLYWGWIDQNSAWGLPLIITSGIVYVLLIPTYLTFYVLTQLMSPSKKILLMLQQKNVLSFDDAIRGIQEENFIGTRMAELRQSGCVVLKDGRYVLSASGVSIATILNVMQVLLGRDAGG